MPQGLSLAQFDAVLFDVDGTLVNSIGMILPGLGDAFEKYSGVRPSDEEIMATIGLPLRVQLGNCLAGQPTDSELGEMIEYTISRYEAYADRETNFEPAIETLRLCKEHGLATALVTSKNDQELALFLNRFAAADAVDATVCASDVVHPKPAPDSALAALSKLGIAPERAVFIGDSIYDMRCAKAAGMARIAVGYGFATPEALLAETPDLYLESPEDLLRWAQTSFSNRNAPKETTHRRTIDNDSDDRAPGAA
jgi:HAD superfamily hydrolase (TIGR01509 family)